LGNGNYELGSGVNIPDNWCALSGYSTNLSSSVGSYPDSVSLGHGGANNTYNITATNVQTSSNELIAVQFSCTSYSNFTTARSSLWYSNATASEATLGSYTSTNILNSTGPNGEGDDNYTCYLMGMSAIGQGQEGDWSTVSLPCAAYQEEWNQVGTGAQSWPRETWATCTQFDGNDGLSTPNYQNFAINSSSPIFSQQVPWPSITLPLTTQAFCALTEIQGGGAQVMFGANDTQYLEYIPTFFGDDPTSAFYAEATCWYFTEAASTCNICNIDCAVCGTCI
jgi:hypothetical protein